TVGVFTARRAPLTGDEMAGAGGGTWRVKLQVSEPAFPARSLMEAETVWTPAERVGLNEKSEGDRSGAGAGLPSMGRTAFVTSIPVPTSDQDARTSGVVVKAVEPSGGKGTLMTGATVSTVNERVFEKLDVWVALDAVAFTV